MLQHLMRSTLCGVAKKWGGGGGLLGSPIIRTIAYEDLMIKSPIERNNNNTVLKGILRRVA